MEPETKIIITNSDPNVDRRVIYECNFSVESKDKDEFCTYLRNHMQEILQLENGRLFDRASLCIAENEADCHETDKRHVCVRYRARSRFKLQEYFDRAGERLRQNMTDEWGGRYTVQRRILELDTVLGSTY